MYPSINGDSIDLDFATVFATTYKKWPVNTWFTGHQIIYSRDGEIRTLDTLLLKHLHIMSARNNIKKRPVFYTPNNRGGSMLKSTNHKYRIVWGSNIVDFDRLCQNVTILIGP